MRLEPISKGQPTFGWQIRQTATRYGNQLVKMTEYYPNDKYRLISTEHFQGSKRTTKTQELYNSAWQLLKRKITEFVDGKKHTIYC